MSNQQPILYELKPCDRTSPYIFISYSSLDSELVWQDVREFQKRGYNVWIDEKNLDKTQPSWREDAINAIEDMECELVVFYVSANSLRSNACYLELSKTVEERTRAMHFGPVKFIAVDAEPVGDITAFARKVHQAIRGSGLGKEERSQQALALSGFMHDFFNSNNEKVRIHPKNEVNRKIDYYDDITASFPDITRVFEPEEEAEEANSEPAAESGTEQDSLEPVEEGGTVTERDMSESGTEGETVTERDPSESGTEGGTVTERDMSESGTEGETVTERDPSESGTEGETVTERDLSESGAEAETEAERNLSESATDAGPVTEVTEEKESEKTKAAILAVRKNLAAAHPDWDSKRLYAVARAIVLGNKDGQKKGSKGESEILSENKALKGKKETLPEKDAPKSEKEILPEKNVPKGEKETLPEKSVPKPEEPPKAETDSGAGAEHREKKLEVTESEDKGKKAGDMPDMNELLKSMNWLLNKDSEQKEERETKPTVEESRMTGAEQKTPKNPEISKTEQEKEKKPEVPEPEQEKEKSLEVPEPEQGKEKNLEVLKPKQEKEKEPEVLELKQETEKKPKISATKQKTEKQDEASWFTKSEEAIPARGAQKIFGKKEVNSTPIRAGVLEIPAGYTSIMVKLSRSMYWGNEKIVELILPDTMTELNISEFQRCINLKTVRLPKYLKKMPSGAFRECTSLKEVVIPGYVEQIGTEVFQGCTSLQKAVLPYGLKELRSRAFDGCASLKEIHLPPQLEKMGMEVFQGCKSLKEVYLPANLQKMEIACFQDCTALETVHIPGSIRKVAGSIFQNCTSLKMVTMEEGVERIDGAFDRCSRVHVYIPDSVTSISTIAFYKTTPIIHCNAGSYAESFAKRNSYSCVLN